MCVWLSAHGGSFPSSSPSPQRRWPATAASCRPGYFSPGDPCICQSAIPKPRCCQSAAPRACLGRLLGHELQCRRFHGPRGRIDPQPVQTLSQLVGSSPVIALITHVVFGRLGNRQQDRPMIQRPCAIVPQPAELFLQGLCTSVWQTTSSRRSTAAPLECRMGITSSTGRQVLRDTTGRRFLPPH